MDGTRTAPVGLMFTIDRILAGAGLLAQVLVSKYCDHTPLYRQSQIYARAGLDLHRSTLTDWVGHLAPLAEAIHWLLKLLRDAGSPQKVVAVGGQFQQNLPQGRSFQLLRVFIDGSQGLVPEISGNRLMFSVRMMRMGEDHRLHGATDVDMNFELSLCA